MATSRRSKGPARWFVLGLSGLATAGFLSAIVSRPGQDQAVPAISATSAVSESNSAPVVTQTYAPSLGNPTLIQTAVQAPAGTQAVARAPRLRTRGS